MESDEFGGYLEDAVVRMSLPVGERSLLSSSIPSVVRKAQLTGRGQKGLKAGRAGGGVCVKDPEVRKGMAPPMSLKGRPVRLEC